MLAIKSLLGVAETAVREHTLEKGKFDKVSDLVEFLSKTFVALDPQTAQRLELMDFRVGDDIVKSMQILQAKMMKLKGMSQGDYLTYIERALSTSNASFILEELHKQTPTTREQALQIVYFQANLRANLKKATLQRPPYQKPSFPGQKPTFPSKKVKPWNRGGERVSFRSTQAQVNLMDNRVPQNLPLSASKQGQRVMNSIPTSVYEAELHALEAQSKLKWTSDGSPICAYCDKPGHLFKTCCSYLEDRRNGKVDQSKFSFLNQKGQENQRF